MLTEWFAICMRCVHSQGLHALVLGYTHTCPCQNTGAEFCANVRRSAQANRLFPPKSPFAASADASAVVVITS